MANFATFTASPHPFPISLLPPHLQILVMALSLQDEDSVLQLFHGSLEQVVLLHHGTEAMLQLPLPVCQHFDLSLEALQPNDVLAAGGILLPKVLPEGVDLQGELPLHLRRPAELVQESLVLLREFLDSTRFLPVGFTQVDLLLLQLVLQLLHVALQFRYPSFPLSFLVLKSPPQFVFLLFQVLNDGGEEVRKGGKKD